MAIDFNNTQTIYMQIVDWVFEQILTAAWKPGDKAKSVRELAVMFEVNPNTVMRSYDDAVEKIKFLRKREFMEEEVPVFIKNVKLLDIDVNEIINLLKA